MDAKTKLRKVEFEIFKSMKKDDEIRQIRLDCKEKNILPTYKDFRNYEIKKGLFHEWGLRSEESQQNYGIDTVGIIEDLNGEIHVIEPEKIKFKN